MKWKELYRLCKQYNTLEANKPARDTDSYKAWTLLKREVEKCIWEYIYEFHWIASYFDKQWNEMYLLHWHESIIIVEPYNDDYVLHINTH